METQQRETIQQQKEKHLSRKTIIKGINLISLNIDKLNKHEEKYPQENLQIIRPNEDGCEALA